MYLSKYLILTLLSVVCLSRGVFGNAGFMKPIPRVGCKELDQRGCKIRTPCHNLNPVSGDVNPINIDSIYEYAIYQLDAKANETSVNTYTIQFFKDQENTGFQLLTFNQNDMNSNNSFYAVKMDPIKLNAKLMDNLEFDRDGYVFGTLELTFDARSGGGDVYYSCANVRFQNKTAAAKSKGQKIKVESTLTLTDGKGNQRGDIESDGKATELIVPDLISHEAKVDSEDIKAQDDEDIAAEDGENNENNNEDEEGSKGKSSSSSLAIPTIIASSFITLASLLIKF
ncbi:hypothetical protein DICPUDRAFT_148638 [Dictyostelium purpureum]|uniref:Uncharacterized protein n=1 Tax=Dictyostelium purpureum TaxID=5786 RepID=F0ZBM2_DICPU|nr:uncharacterized protein DICPUDRAFT_148638 [Dictyostelium purpureum]EGC38646.1 hypothetical protein DICPUDRAFT_148638 [Dictyostelium purpureum]|eukprot:XP_003284839.1 hypothetical protein DICPUDRAFT_148638 [Dictyostelium purpureum]